MASSFTLFPDLPPEIRRLIWVIAASQSWSYTTHRQNPTSDQRIISIGKVDPPVRQSCYEARAFTAFLYTRVNGPWPFPKPRPGLNFAGSFNFERHLFFFRGYSRYNWLLGRLIRKSDSPNTGLLAKMQHLVLKPRSYRQLLTSLNCLLRHALHLRTLVVVAPWSKLTDDDADWSKLFEESPQELNITRLLDEINAGVPSSIYDGPWNEDDDLKRMLEEFPRRKILFLMRTKEDFNT